jgi:uncharacterized repeat protein (TIGR03803 family)
MGFKMKTRFLLSLVLLPVLAHAQTYTESILYSFGSASNDGINPWGGLVMDSAGNLYGTTTIGGDVSCHDSKDGVGCGTVFKVDAAGNETILHTFRGGLDGATPVNSLTMDKAGNLYGITLYGGYKAGQGGTVFKVSPSGEYSILHAFTGAPDGQNPWESLTLDADGNIYGTTTLGGNSVATPCQPRRGTLGCGTVFKLNPKGVETILYNFNADANGASPTGNLLLDSAGNLYGTAQGGANNYGVLFKLSSANVVTVLYSFCSEINCADGTIPADITSDSEGNLYGIAGNDGFSIFGSGFPGVVFEYSTAGVETALYTFCIGFTCPNGDGPYGHLLLSGGNIYGTTYGSTGHGAGTVYELTTTGIETVLYFFDYNVIGDGTGPLSGVISDQAGNLYGTTYGGGAQAKGTVFKLTKN